MLNGLDSEIVENDMRKHGPLKEMNLTKEEMSFGPSEVDKTFKVKFVHDSV